MRYSVSRPASAGADRRGTASAFHQMAMGRQPGASRRGRSRRDGASRYWARVRVVPSASTSVRNRARSTGATTRRTEAGGRAICTNDDCPSSSHRGRPPGSSCRFQPAPSGASASPDESCTSRWVAPMAAPVSPVSAFAPVAVEGLSAEPANPGAGTPAHCTRGMVTDSAVGSNSSANSPCQTTRPVRAGSRGNRHSPEARSGAVATRRCCNSALSGTRRNGSGSSRGSSSRGTYSTSSSSRCLTRATPSATSTCTPQCPCTRRFRRPMVTASRPVAGSTSRASRRNSPGASAKLSANSFAGVRSATPVAAVSRASMFSAA